MNTKVLKNNIETMDFLNFEKVWNEIRNSLTEADIQNLLTEIVDYHYTDKYYSFYVKVFDKIIESKVSLDFNIDHWPPTFLSLSVWKPSIRLFNYFIRKGANINFIGDNYAFETIETIELETVEQKLDRYSTCLDFAELKLADKLTVDYNYFVPEINQQITSWDDIDEKEEITVKKQHYYNLIAQSQYLQDLIYTDRLVDHIKSLGGKTYNELRDLQ